MFSPSRDLPVFVFFAFVAGISVLPGSLHVGRALLGYPGDSFQHAWFLWHFARSLSHGSNPYYTNLIFYPHRVNLAWSTLDPIASLLALPFSLIAGPIVAYNLSLILQLALAAFFAYLLCLRVCANAAASIIGGICFGFSPWLMGEALGHLSLVTAFPIPLYFLALDAVLRRERSRWRDGILLALALLLTAFAHYNYTVFCILLTLVIVIADLALDGRELARRVWKPLTAAAIGFAILFSPLFMLLWSNPAARPHPREADLIEGHSADLFGWFVPSWNHMLFGRFAQHWNLGLFSAGYEGIVYLGPVIPILAVVGFWSGCRTNRKWATRLLAAALVFWALSLGPHIRVWGRQTRIPGPALFIYGSRFGRFASAPARFHVIAMLCFAGLAAMGIAHILKKLSSATRRTALVGLLSMVLTLDLLVLPFPMATPEASVRHKGFAIAIDGCTIPADVSGRTVVTVPELNWPFPVRAMWMQVSDGGRYALADGYVSYGPDSLWDNFWNVPILRSLREIQEGNRPPIDSNTVVNSLPAAERDLNLGAFVVFDFSQRAYTVRYLENVLRSSAVSQPNCTIFDLQQNTSPQPNAAPRPITSALY